MKLRLLCVLGILALAMFVARGAAQPQPRQPAAPPAPGEPGGAEYEGRVLATLMDSERKEESKDPGKYANDAALLDDVRLYKATMKTPMSRYRLAFPNGKPDPQGHYGIDVYERGDARLLPLEGGTGDAAWKKPAFDGNEEKVFSGDLQDVEIWSRVVDRQTELLARCAREKVVLEVLVRNANSDAAGREVRERFGLFYRNAVENRLFGGADDYWKWFVRFGRLSRQNGDEIACIMATLGVKAEERRRLLKRWQELMQMENEAWPSDDGLAFEWAVLVKHAHDQNVAQELGDFTHKEPPLSPLTPTLNLAKMKAARDKVAKPYKALYAEQADLMVEAERHMQAIVASIEQTWNLAKRNPTFATESEKKHLDMSLGYWKDQQALLKMRLYDAAGWHRPEEFARVVEELKLTSDADSEITRLMKAKLLLATTGDIERRIWLQRISPSYQREGRPLGRLDRHGADSFVSLRTPDFITPLPAPRTTDSEHPVVFLTIPKGFRAQLSPLELAAQKTHLDVVAALHDILKDNPRNEEARRMLSQQEFRILNWIAGKMERERGASWAAFQKFFTDRGYNEEAMPHDAWETAWVYWSNPWTSAGHNIAGTPEGLEDAVGADEEAAAANLVTMNLLRRLSSRGLLLSEIRQLKEEDFGKRLVLGVKGKDGKDKPVPVNFKALRRDMFAAFNDPNLGLGELAAGDVAGFLDRFNKTYFDVFEPNWAWAESIAEYCLSPQALLFTVGPHLTPMLRLPATANKWAYVAKVGEEYKTIEQMASGWMNLAGLSKRLNDTTLAGWVAKDMEFIKGLGTAEWLARVGGGRTAAACGLYIGLVQVTEEYDLPRTRLLVHCLFELQASNVAYDILGKARAPGGPVAGMVNQFRRECFEESEKLGALVGTKTKAGALQEVDELFKELAAAAGEEERARYRARLKTLQVFREGYEIAKNADKTIKALGTNSAADRRWATKCWSEALERGDVSEMKKIGQAVRSVAETTKQEVDQHLEKSTVVAKMLEEVTTVTSPVRRTELKTLAEEAEKTAEAPRFFQTEDVYKKPGGEAMLAADQTMRAGEFATAEMAYGKGARRAEELGEEELAALQRQRRAQAGVARSTEEMKLAARKAVAKAPELPKLLQSFTEEEIQALKNNPEFVKDITTEVFVLKVGDKKYVFKIFNPDAAGIKYKGLDSQLNPILRPEAEARALFARTIVDGCTASEIAKDLTMAAKEAGKNFEVPVSAAQKVHLKFKYRTSLGVEREIDEIGVLTRFFDGVDLKDVSLPEALAYKKEIGILRVFSALVGDPDRHAGNIRVNPRIGEILGIDLENAHFADNVEHLLMGGRLQPGNEDDYLQLLLDFVTSHGRPRPNGRVHTLYGPAARIDEMLVYADMHEFVDLIEKRYSGAEGRAKLEEIIKRGYKLNGIESVAPAVVTARAKVVQERIFHLHVKLKKKFPGMPPGTTRLMPRNDRGAALCRAAEPVRLLAA